MMIRDASNVKKFLLGPLCVLYCYFYKNYLRMGKSEDYAKLWAPTSAVGSLLGIIFLFIHPLDIICNYLMRETNALAPEGCGIIYLSFFLLLVIIGASFLRRKGHKILIDMNDVNIPKIPILLCVALLFILPPVLISISLGKYHFYLASALIAIYYTAFYMIYFRRVLKRQR